MSVIDDLLTDKYLLRDILQIYRGILQEQKQLHEINCPDCEAKEKPCKRYYWLFLDIQELEYKSELLITELKDGYLGK